jgi:hypothetical protein
MLRRPDGLATRSDWTPTMMQARFMALMTQRARQIGLRE